MRITFLGATKTVTGSRYLLELKSKKKILIDCGLFQGPKELRLRNWALFPVPPKSIETVLFTHAHIDHTGYFPVLVKHGFAGQAFCTPATKDLVSILLPDSGHLQEEEAKFANYTGYSKHTPALPLYNREEAEHSLRYIHTKEFKTAFQLDEFTTAEFMPAGHILGASFILIRDDETCILFSGDMGRQKDALMYPPTQASGADYLVIESTYGNKIHDENYSAIDRICETANNTFKRGGALIIPAFAVGRTQLLLLDIYKLKKAGRIPDVPVFLDSPMAIDATHIFNAYASEHRLTEHQCQAISGIAKYTNNAEESKQIDSMSGPMIVISASGMATGGRILHHLKVFGPDEKNTILFVGHQTVGTRGAQLTKGEKEIKIHGEIITVNAQVQLIENTSSHADSKEIIEWLTHWERKPKEIFITHGELPASEALKTNIEKHFGWSCYIPNYLDSRLLGQTKMPQVHEAA